MKHNERVAVVTGANRGIGLEICRQLGAKEFLVVLTSRDEQKGREACKRLEKEEMAVRYHQLDVDQAASIQRFSQFIEKEFGRCDVLVNNAGVLLDGEGDGSSVFHAKLDVVRKTMETNVYGPLLLTQAFIPLMKRNKYGRIVNLSSGMGQLSDMDGGYPSYRISKTAINALTRILAAELQGADILVNSMCPGWVKTDMGGPNATRAVEEGADTAVCLATLPNGGPTGKFFRDRKEIPW